MGKRTSWINQLRLLPAGTRAAVWREIRLTVHAGEDWTPLRPFLDGEPLDRGCKRQCCGAQPCDAKGRMPRCKVPPTYTRYAVGGLEQGMDQPHCAACADALQRRIERGEP